ncbi:MAG: hypothetical protein UX67_C0010G0004 [Candidatus Woesebacteria bacterium GW2011_GWF2_46_8]|uniref:Uncharacterized protein n=4 Tax=Candidatus Woeseibacteriota TaxID=1752722 RepID=A0A0G1T3H6_9BACT|nr:MAG: hypothetical protein UX67_C0010G0004 [Candidatus Woesebacteria bacterium GW2011_GWF2_46_8]
MPDIFINPPEEKKEAETPTPRSFEPEPKFKKHKAPGHTHNPLAAYCYLPDKVNFETRESEEKVILLLRQHPITLVPKALIALLMILAPSILSIFPILSFLPVNFQLIAVLFWYLITTAFILESFLTWFFNVYLITDERIVDIDFLNLLYKEVSDANIDKIQDVTYKMAGAVRTLFNYGDVLIQTASEVPNFDFLAVPRPDKVATVLQDLRIEEEQEKLEGRIR